VIIPSSRAAVSPLRLLAVTVAALSGSLVACALIVAVGIRAFPLTAGYPHFAFHDYAWLTTLGVVGAAVVWSILNRITARASAAFLWISLATLVVSLAPDVWIASQGQPPEAVTVLVVMHVAVAVVTVTALESLAVPAQAAASRPSRVP
jgi:hypothetical protein